MHSIRHDRAQSAMRSDSAAARPDSASVSDLREWVVPSEPSYLAAALQLATLAHEGRTYPSPEAEPYICHPVRVMESLRDIDEQIVALLHDVLEDTPVGVAELRAHGFQDHVIEAVVLLTHDGAVAYADYIERLAPNRTAQRVKLADIADNLRNNRRLEPTPEVQARISRYEAAQLALMQYETDATWLAGPRHAHETSGFRFNV